MRLSSFSPLCLALALPTLFAACGGKAEEDDQTDPAPSFTHFGAGAGGTGAQGGTSAAGEGGAVDLMGGMSSLGQGGGSSAEGGASGAAGSGGTKPAAGQGGAGDGGAGGAGGAGGGASGKGAHSGGSPSGGAGGAAGSAGDSGTSGAPDTCGAFSPDMGCGTCLDDLCCVEATACDADESCFGCLDGGDSMAYLCDANAAYVSLLACKQEHCAALCAGAGGGAGGAAGAGGVGGAGCVADPTLLCLAPYKNPFACDPGVVPVNIGLAVDCMVQPHAPDGAIQFCCEPYPCQEGVCDPNAGQNCHTCPDDCGACPG